MKFVAKSIALAVLVLVTAGPSYAQPLRSTAIPSGLADDEKRLMPEVMTEFYGSFDREKACWISKHEDTSLHEANRTYCMKPIRLDVIKSTGRKMLFIVAGGQKLDEEGRPEENHAAQGVFGLIVLTPNGANLDVVATNDLYEGFETYGGYPQHDAVTIHKLGPNGAYGWVAKLVDQHSGYDIRWVQVYGVIGNSVKSLTAVGSCILTKAGAVVGRKSIAPPFRSNTRSKRIHQQARFIPSYCGFRALNTGALFSATTAWSSIRNRSHT